MPNIPSLIADLISGDEDRAEAAVAELSELCEEAVPALTELLAHDSGEIRWWATWAVAETRCPSAPGLLLRMLDDPDVVVQQCAALGLREQPNPEAVPKLIECLQSANPSLAHLAGAALVAAGPDAVPALLDVLEHGSKLAKLEAVRALSYIGDARSIPSLFAALQKDSALMDYWANEGLNRMGIGMAFFKP
jgi:HEAT repeat protein